jgi:transmembrane sensor
MKFWSRWFMARPQNASEWFARTKSDDAGKSDDRRLTEWLSKSVSNEQDYEMAEVVWLISGELKGDPDIDRLSSKAAKTKPSFVVRLGVVTAVIGVIAAILFFAEAQHLSFHATYATAVGEQRSVFLPDGSRVFLNTASALRVNYSLKHREIWLDGGEATFEVTKSPWRPFEVRTSKGTAVAVGTRFDVFVRPQSLEVAIIEGAVAVRPASLTGAGLPTIVHAGEVLTVNPAFDVSVHRGELSSILQHQFQRLEFDGVSVADAISEFNRYSRRPVRVATPDIGALQISGVFHAGDIETFVHSLEASLPISVIEQEDSVLLVSKGGSH